MQAIALCSWWDSCAWGTFLALESPRKASGKAAKVNLPCHISYEFWMPPTFVTLIGSVWLLNQKKWWNTKLTCKCGRPSITVKSWTRQLHVASYSGSRQGILQLLQTWETKTWSFSHSKKLHASKEVKKFPKLLQSQILSETKYIWNQYTGNTSAYDPSISKGNICSVKTKNPPQHSPPTFWKCQF